MDLGAELDRHASTRLIREMHPRSTLLKHTNVPLSQRAAASDLNSIGQTREGRIGPCFQFRLEVEVSRTPEDLQGKEAHPDPRDQERTQVSVEISSSLNHSIEIDGLRGKVQLLQLLPPI
jgi:hypothetical protein